MEVGAAADPASPPGYEGAPPRLDQPQQVRRVCRRRAPESEQRPERVAGYEPRSRRHHDGRHRPVGVRHGKNEKESRQAGHLAQDRAGGAGCLVREQVEPGDRPGHECHAQGRPGPALRIPTRDFHRVVAVGEVGPRIACEQFDSRRRGVRRVEVRREPLQQRGDHGIARPQAVDVSFGQQHALAHRLPPHERHGPARGDDGDRKEGTPRPARQSERPYGANPERRIPDRVRSGRLDQQGRDQCRDCGYGWRDPRRKTAAGAKNCLSGGRARDQHEDRSEEDRRLPCQPERRRHARRGNPDAASQVAQEEGADSGDDQNAKQRLDSGTRRDARAQ